MDVSTDLKGRRERQCCQFDRDVMEHTLSEETAKVRDLMQRFREEALMEAAYYCYGGAVAGDIVEFGTMTGATARAIAVAMCAVEQQYDLPAKRLFLFDSFVGLPEPDAAPDAASPHVQLGHWAAGGCKGLTKAELNSQMLTVLPDHRFELVEGWYMNTVPQIPKDQKFAMVHIDCDLYSSTMDALQPLFERGQISSGATICFDDWMCNQANPEFGEQRAFSELSVQFDIEFSQWGSYSWSGARFIVHSYRK